MIGYRRKQFRGEEMGRRDGGRQYSFPYFAVIPVQPLAKSRKNLRRCSHKYHRQIKGIEVLDLNYGTNNEPLFCGFNLVMFRIRTDVQLTTEQTIHVCTAIDYTCLHK